MHILLIFFLLTYTYLRLSYAIFSCIKSSFVLNCIQMNTIVWLEVAMRAKLKKHFWTKNYILMKTRFIWTFNFDFFFHRWSSLCNVKKCHRFLRICKSANEKVLTISSTSYRMHRWIGHQYLWVEPYLHIFDCIELWNKREHPGNMNGEKRHNCIFEIKTHKFTVAFCPFLSTARIYGGFG